MRYLIIVLSLFLITCGGGGGGSAPTEPEDTIPPTITIQSPLSGSTVSELVNVQINAQDNIGVSRVEIFLDNELAPIATLTSAPFQYSLNTSTLTDGDHTLAASAYDASGNKSTAQPVLIIVDNTASRPSKIYLDVYYYNPYGSEHESKIYIQTASTTVNVTFKQSGDSDFKSYRLFKSDYPDMSNKEEVFYSEIINNSETDLEYVKNDIYYLQLEVEDQVGLTTQSNITRVTTYETYYWRDEGDASYFAFETQEGTYLHLGDDSIGQTSVATETRNVGLVNPQSDGDCYSHQSRGDNVVVDWEKSGYEFSRDIKVANDGLIMISGGIENGTYTDKQIIKIDFSGNELWTFNMNENQQGDRFEPTDDDGVLIYDAKSSNLGDLIRIDSSGNEIWKKEISTRVTSIIKSSNSNEFILGTNFNNYDSETNTHTLIDNIIKINGNGEELDNWSTNSIGGSDTSSEYIHRLIPLTNGEFLANIGDGSSGSSTLHLFDDTLLRKTSKSQEYVAINSIDNGFVIVEQMLNNNNYDIVIFDNQLNEINRFVNILGCRYFYNQGWTEGIDYIFQTSDGGFVVSGRTSSSFKLGKLVMKLDPEGEYHSQAKGGEDYDL